MLVLVGTTAFIGMLLYICMRPAMEVQLQEKTLISTFFLSAITCLGFSTAFHILSCHSEKCASLFAKYMTLCSTFALRLQCSFMCTHRIPRSPALNIL